MSLILKTTKSSIDFSCIQTGIQFAYGRLWTFLESCTSYAYNVFTAVFIGAEEPPLQPVRRPQRQVLRVEPKPKVKNDSDDEDIPDGPLPSSLAKFEIPRSNPIRIPPRSPEEEKLQEIEAKIALLMKKPQLTQEEIGKIDNLIGILAYQSERLSAHSFSPRIEQFYSELAVIATHLKSNRCEQ